VNDDAGLGSVWVQLLPSLIIILVFVIPFLRILRRAGRSRWWALLLLIPGIGWLILPWVIAFMRWDVPSRNLDEVFR
jgi:uncharacterized membrane protein YhaH (DUF805 family)